MLVECPRCHFKQPQDQYCASCGVDMLAYKPKEEPILTKLVSSGLFQFLMVVFLGIAVTWFVVRTDQPQKLIQRINRFASVTPPVNSKTATEAGLADDQAEFEAPAAESNSWTARAASETNLALTANTSSTTAVINIEPDSNARVTLVSGTAKVLFRMVEIDHDYLDTLTSEKNGRTTDLGGNIEAFRTFPRVSVDSSNFKALKTDVLEFSKDKKNQSLIAGNLSRGFRLQLQVLDDLQGKTFRFFNMSYTKMHPNDNQQLTFELFLDAEEKTIISGSDIISYLEVENDIANMAPFQIFKSADYRNQKTTFAIIIELQ